MYVFEEADRLLLKRAKRGDTQAFADLYRHIYQDLYRFALCMMKHPQDAEDMVSETVILAYENLPGLRKPESFGSWIFKILSNQCKSRLKQQAKVISMEERREYTPEAAMPETDHAQMQDVRDAFQTLPEEERLIVGLSVLCGYQSPEIGKMLQMPPGTVRSKQSRAMEKLRRLLI